MCAHLILDWKLTSKADEIIIWNIQENALEKLTYESHFSNCGMDHMWSGRQKMSEGEGIFWIIQKANPQSKIQNVSVPCKLSTFRMSKGERIQISHIPALPFVLECSMNQLQNKARNYVLWIQTTMLWMIAANSFRIGKAGIAWVGKKSRKRGTFSFFFFGSLHRFSPDKVRSQANFTQYSSIYMRYKKVPYRDIQKLTQ